MLLTEQDRGCTVTVAVGGSLTVRLRENPTTGYRWQVQDADGLVVTQDRYEGEGAIGAERSRIIEFRAVRAGSHVIRLRNWREWSGAIADRFYATVVVK